MDTIRVIYHCEPDGWWAESLAIAGWSATASTVDELRPLVEDGVRFALDRDDVIVAHALEGIAGASIVFDFAANASRVQDSSATPGAVLQVA